MKSIVEHLSLHSDVSHMLINEDAKDDKRIADIIAKSNGDNSKAMNLSKVMANKITSVSKAEARAEAAYSVDRSDLGDIFANRAKELGSTKFLDKTPEVSIKEETVNKTDLYTQLEPSTISKAKMNKLTNDQFAALYANKSLVIKTTADYGKIFSNNNIENPTDDIIAKTYNPNGRNMNEIRLVLVLVRNITEEFAEITAVNISSYLIYASTNLSALTSSSWKKIDIGRIRSLVNFAGTDKNSLFSVVEDQNIEFYKLFGFSLKPIVSKYLKAEMMLLRIKKIFDKHYQDFSYDDSRKSKTITKSSDMIVKAEGDGTTFAAITGGKAVTIGYDQYDYASYAEYYGGNDIQLNRSTVSLFDKYSRYSLMKTTQYCYVTKDEAEECQKLMQECIPLFKEAKEALKPFVKAFFG